MDTTAEYRIAAMDAEHARQVLTIYQLGIDEGNATFETTGLMQVRVTGAVTRPGGPAWS